MMTKVILCRTFVGVFLDLPEPLLYRKIELCKNIIEVYDKVDPGEASQRMNVMFELNCATIIVSKMELERKRFKRDEAMVWKLSIRFSYEKQ